MSEGNSGEFETKDGNKIISIEEGVPTPVPFVDELAMDADRLIQERVGEWRKEGKRIDLDYMLLCLQVTGKELPGDLDSVKVVVGGKGSVGDRLSSTEFLQYTMEIISDIAESSGKHDPIVLLNSLHQAFNGFVEDLHPIAERREARGRFAKLRERFRQQDSTDMIVANNRYMRVVQHIMQTGSMEVPEGAPEDVEGLESLSREDFDG